MVNNLSVRDLRREIKNKFFDRLSYVKRIKITVYYTIIFTLCSYLYY